MNEISEKLILPSFHHCGDSLSQSMIQNQPESTEQTTVSQENQVSPKLNIHDTKIQKIPVEHTEAFFEEHKTEADIPLQCNERSTSSDRNLLDNPPVGEMNPQISQRQDLLATSNPSSSIHDHLRHTEELVEPLELDREVDFGLPDEDENQESEEQVQRLITKMGNIKATFYLRHSMAFFIAFLLVSRYSLEFVDNGSCSKEIFIVLYTYLTYAFLEEVTFYFRYKTTDNDAKITYIYAGLDVFSLLCSLLILHLKFLNIFPAGKAASLPGFVICTLFYFSAYQRKGAKKLFLLKRILETIQIYLIEAKIDGGLAHLPWKSLLVYTWLYVGVRILLLLTSLKSVKPLIPQTSNKRANIFLTLWHYFYILLLLTVLVTYIGYSQAFDSKGSFDLLRKCLVGGQYFSAILFLLTILTKPFLIMVFTRASSMDYQSSEFGEMILDPLSIGISKQLKQEKKVVYFSMLSTTYFHEIKKGKFGQNRMGLEEFKQNIVFMLIQRLKKILHTNYDSLSQNLKKLVFQRIMDIQKNLMHHMTEVQLLDFRRKTTSANRAGNSQSTEIEPSFNRSELINLLDSLSAQAKRLWNIHKNRKPKSKDAHEDEDDEYEMHDNGIDHTKTHENLCYVCFSQPADGIFMECGHAGFCFDCGLRYMTEKKECMTCRGATERVAKIDLKPVFGNVYKGYMVGKIVITVDDNRCQWLIN